MLVVRQVPGAGQFDPNDPATGLIDLSVVAPGYPEVPWVIKSGGYNSSYSCHGRIMRYYNPWIKKKLLLRPPVARLAYPICANFSTAEAFVRKALLKQAR